MKKPTPPHDISGRPGIKGRPKLTAPQQLLILADNLEEIGGALVLDHAELIRQGVNVTDLMDAARKLTHAAVLLRDSVPNGAGA